MILLTMSKPLSSLSCNIRRSNIPLHDHAYCQCHTNSKSQYYTTNEPFSHALFRQDELETNRCYPVVHQNHGSINQHQAHHRPMDQTTTSTRRNVPKKKTSKSVTSSQLPCLASNRTSNKKPHQQIVPLSRP